MPKAAEPKAEEPNAELKAEVPKAEGVLSLRGFPFNYNSILNFIYLPAGPRSVTKAGLWSCLVIGYFGASSVFLYHSLLVA